MILADTSVWIDHLRTLNPEMQTLLLNKRILMHPFVIGEIACGTLRDRTALLASLRDLRQSRLATNEEVFELIERRRLWGRGIGWVDAHLLASALLTRCRLWSFDQQLQAAARLLNIDYRQALM
jgi:predicted nucleic acid-binding protein